MRSLLRLVLLLPLAFSAYGQDDGSARVAAAAARKASALLERSLAASPQAASRPAQSAQNALDEARGLLVSEGMAPGLAEILVAGPLRTGPDRARRAASPARTLQAARDRLLAFARAAEGSPPSVSANARSRLERILQDPVFNTRPAHASLVQRFTDTLKRSLFTLIQSVVGAMEKYPLFLRAAVFALVFAGLVVLALTVGSMFRRRLQRGSHPEPPIAARLAETTDANELLSRAATEAAAGRLDGSMRLLQKAAVVALRSRGELPRQPGLTDLEGVRSLSDRVAPEVHEAFERLAEIHDRNIYAGRGIVVKTLEEALVLARRIVGTPEREAA